MFRIDDREHREAGLLHDEVAEFAEVRLWAIDGEPFFDRLARVITEGREVAAFDRHLLFLDGIDEAAFDVLLGAWAVADD